jgi:hypothetical protein
MQVNVVASAADWHRLCCHAMPSDPTATLTCIATSPFYSFARDAVEREDKTKK